MKIQEFRDLLKSADRDKLEKAFAECYKQFSKAKKEEIDLLVQDILSGNEKKKAEKGKMANFEELESQYYERAVQCLWDLYDVLCRGCEVYLFSSDDPFASVRWE